ncbi:nucleoporin protein Ndc1-Nup [Suillus bovinus]|uniref:nucleoporin protein Ndc1-Nup n=1 Tax=Suillus bovinus TaxID=48563 RepID=UPI001B86A9F1|nr:nucleoporin protein Ndc1-Nup [Suillus bovinus]KAG2151633.1 nucleoporin protein Ndc1-Nup [Suillus bovinus]
MSAGMGESIRTRAITSTLTARLSPTVPSASQTYELLVRSALRQRLTHNIFVFSAAFTLVVSILLGGEDETSAFARLLSPGTWMMACLKWFVGVLPVIAMRKVYLTSAATPATSPAKILTNAISKPSTRRCWAVYMSCTLMLITLYMSSFTSEERENLRLNVFVKSRKHPYYLNGRLLFLILAQLWLATSFLLRNIMLDRFVFRWTKNVNSSELPYATSNVLKQILTMALFTSFSLMLYGVAFGLSRMLILPLLLKLPVVSSIIRPFVAHFAKGTWTLTLPILHWSLLVRSFMMGFVTLMSWEFAESLFDAYVPQPIKVGALTADPNVTVVSGITTQDTVFAHFAYSELADLASDESSAGSARRIALFGDQKYSPSLWSVLARQSLLRLGQDYQTFLRRGAPITPPVVVAPTIPKPKDPPSTPLIRKAIFKAPRQSPLSSMLDSVSSDSELSKAAEAVAGEMEERASQMHIPELFRSVAPSSAAAPSTDAVPAKPASNVMSSFIAQVKLRSGDLVVGYCPIWLKESAIRWNKWFYRERLNKVVEVCLPNRELDALIIEALSHFVCASLSEDRYGVVQRDIPRIIEAFLSFLSAIEQYQIEVNAKYTPPTPDELSQGDTKILEEKEMMRLEVARASDVLVVVSDALKTGVANISRTFGDKLVAFKFPPRTARKLQSFVDYT